MTETNMNVLDVLKNNELFGDFFYYGKNFLLHCRDNVLDSYVQSLKRLQNLQHKKDEIDSEFGEFMVNFVYNCEFNYSMYEDENKQLNATRKYIKRAFYEIVTDSNGYATITVNGKRYKVDESIDMMYDSEDEGGFKIEYIEDKKLEPTYKTRELIAFKKHYKEIVKNEKDKEQLDKLIAYDNENGEFGKLYHPFKGTINMNVAGKILYENQDSSTYKQVDGFLSRLRKNFKKVITRENIKNGWNNTKIVATYSYEHLSKKENKQYNGKLKFFATNDEREQLANGEITVEFLSNKYKETLKHYHVTEESTGQSLKKMIVDQNNISDYESISEYDEKARRKMLSDIAEDLINGRVKRSQMIKVLNCETTELYMAMMTDIKSSGGHWKSVEPWYKWDNYKPLKNYNYTTKTMCRGDFGACQNNTTNYLDNAREFIKNTEIARLLENKESYTTKHKHVRTDGTKEVLDAWSEGEFFMVDREIAQLRKIRDNIKPYTKEGKELIKNNEAKKEENN